MKKEWNKDAEYALGFYKGINRILGIYPSECHNMVSKIRMLIILLLNWFLICEVATDLIMRCGTMDKTIESVMVMVSTLVSITKIIFPRIHSENLKIIVESAIDDWTRNIDNASREIMRKWAEYGRFLFILEILSFCILIVCKAAPTFPISALINMAENHSTERSLPWGSGCWLLAASDKTFLFFYIIVCVQVFVEGISNLAYDVSFFMIANHICGEIEILHIDFHCHWREENLEKTINQKKAHRKFINRHNDLLKMCSLLENPFHLVILIHMLFYLSMATVVLFSALAAWQQRNTLMLIQTFTTLVIAYTQFLVFCYAGERITNQLENLRDRVYSTPWYNLPPSLMADIHFILRRLNDPFYLTCGKFHPLNMENFRKVVTVTASYCSVMRLILSD